MRAGMPPGRSHSGGAPGGWQHGSGEGSRPRRRVGIGGRERLAGRPLCRPRATEIARLRHRGSFDPRAWDRGDDRHLQPAATTVMLRFLPVKDPESLVLVGGPQYPVFQAYQAHTNIFTDLFATSGVTSSTSKSRMASASARTCRWCRADTSRRFGVQAAIGRTFTADDDRTPGAHHDCRRQAYGYWQRRFRPRRRRSQSRRPHRWHADHDRRRRAAGLFR